MLLEMTFSYRLQLEGRSSFPEFPILADKCWPPRWSETTSLPWVDLSRDDAIVELVLIENIRSQNNRFYFRYKQNLFKLLQVKFKLKCSYEADNYLLKVSSE